MQLEMFLAPPSTLSATHSLSAVSTTHASWGSATYR